MSQKMGFNSVLAVVFGSQIGAGILVLPAQLAPFGYYGIFGWILAGVVAMMLAFIFAELCEKYPVTGGVYAYVQKIFGNKAAFFTGWTYWIASMVSNIVLVITAINCLSVFIGHSSILHSCLEVGLIFALMLLNCTSVKLSGWIEIALTILKFIPFLIVPLLILPSFDISNIQVSEHLVNNSTIEVLAKVLLMSFFCFVGVECATVPAGSVENPKKTIPRAIIIGTACVVGIYFVNTTSIMGTLPGKELTASAAPFVDAIQKVYGTNISIIVSVITSIVVIGTLNAWILTSSQILFGLAKDGFMPEAVSKQNSSGSPYVSVIINCISMLPILFLTKVDSLSAQVMNIIDFSVITFVFVYAMCTLSFIRISKGHWIKVLFGLITLSVCVLVIYKSPKECLLYSSLFVMSGVLILPFAQKKMCISLNN